MMKKAKMTREEKLQNAQRQHKLLHLELRRLQEEKKPIENRIRSINSKIYNLGQKIYALKFEGETPQITDHAIVRYLERVEGVDIKELKSKVANHKRAHKVDNVIVTVMPAENIEEKVGEGVEKND